MSDGKQTIQIPVGDKATITLACIGTDMLPAQLSGFNRKANVQLLENRRYEYSIENCELEVIPGIVMPSKLSNGKTGYLTTRNYVGHLQLKVKTLSGHVEPVSLEVQSSLVDYQKDFKQMVSDLVEAVADIQMQINAPSSGWVKPNQEASKTRQQRLFYLLGLIRGERFRNAVQRVVDYPNHVWEDYRESGDIRRPCRIGASQVRSLAAAGNRIPVSSTSRLYSTLTSLPRRIEFSNKRKSVDTPENRFVKFALNFFRHELHAFRRELGDSASSTLMVDLEAMERTLDGWLSKSFFRDVGQLSSSCFSSPVLQRREGYREILLRWIQYKLGCCLDWEGSGDVYHAGQRDIASLYEYWCFFKLLNVMRRKFGIQIQNTGVIELCDAKEGQLPMRLCLKAGKTFECAGTYEHDDVRRKLHVKFSYNRTFANERDNTGADQLSWTLQLRPDYTFSFWPHTLTEDEATKHDLITHVHFDAKYKAREILEAIKGDEESRKDDESEQEYKSRLDAKRIDLIKMHCYRDAIHRTGGAYVLYPGEGHEGTTYRGFHEIIPGLGAFPLRPNAGDEGEIGRFLDEVLGVLCDRLSQWENYTYQKHKTFRAEIKDRGPDQYDSLNELDLDAKRINIAESRLSTDFLYKSVLYGTTHGKQQIKWIEKHGLYNIPVGEITKRRMTEIDAKRMKRLVLVPPPRPSDDVVTTVYQVEKFLGVVSADELKRKYDYHQTSKNDQYWLWKIALDPETLPQ